MLDRGQLPSWSELPQSAVDSPAADSNGRAAVDGRVQAADELTAQRARRTLLQPRVVVAALLILGALVWAAARGLHFYGLSPINVVYDLDQPPLLVVLVGAWLLYRSGDR